MTDAQCLTIEECAKHLKVSRLTVARLVKRGDIESMLIGKRLRRIKSTALEAYMDRNTGK